MNPLHLHKHHDTDSSDDEYLYTIKDTSLNKHTGCPYAKVKIGGQSISLMVDTGASINVLDRNTFEKLKAVKLHPTKIKAYPFTSKQPVEFRGKFETMVESKSKYRIFLNRSLPLIEAAFD